MKRYLTVCIAAVATVIAGTLAAGRDAAAYIGVYWVLNTILCWANAKGVDR